MYGIELNMVFSIMIYNIKSHMKSPVWTAIKNRNKIWITNMIAITGMIASAGDNIERNIKLSNVSLERKKFGEHIQKY